jgi:hypothetical protein
VDPLPGEVLVDRVLDGVVAQLVVGSVGAAALDAAAD